MRLFIAIEIPEDIKKLITEVQGKIKASGVNANWTRPEGVHFTLKFFGEVPESKVGTIMTGLTSACKGINTFQLEISNAGAFPNIRNPRVIWLGISGDTGPLAKIQVSIEEGMANLGFEREKRKFSPHLTLARIKFLRAKDNWQKALENVKDIKFPAFIADHVSLMKSELNPSGAVYTEIGRIALTK